MGLVFVIIFFAVCIGLAVFGFMRKRKQERAMADFAMQQGWTALGNDPVILDQYVPLYLRGLGNSHSYDMAYQGTLNGRNIVFFEYTYRVYIQENSIGMGNGIGIGVGNGINTGQTRSQDYTFTVAYTQLANNHSNLVLLHHTILSKLTGIGSGWGLEKLSLEGDFNSHFDTYITPNTQDEALSLLTPDVMALFIDDLQNASVQIDGQAFMLSTETSNLSPTTIMPILTNIAAIASKIDAKPGSTAPIIAAPVAPAMPVLPAAPAPVVIAPAVEPVLPAETPPPGP